MTREFDNKLLNYFNAEQGAYSLVTERESEKDSQITLAGREKIIALEHFGEENILKGSAKNDEKLALKEFRLFPNGQLITLNLIFPKPQKKELRLYLNKEKFKPNTNDIWFIFKRKKALWIGSLQQDAWNEINQIENVTTPNTNKGYISKSKALEHTIKRMVNTAFSTAYQADGSLKLTKKKIKDADSFDKKSLHQYILHLIKTQQGICALTGLTLQYDHDFKDDALRASLDRIDSSAHYERGNLQVVCKFANSWKGHSENKEFLRLINLIKTQSDQ